MHVNVRSVVLLFLLAALPGFAACSRIGRLPSVSSASLNGSAATDLKEIGPPAKEAWDPNKVLLEILNRDARERGLQPLSETTLAPGDSEIRIWSGFGLTGTTCLMIKHHAGMDTLTLSDRDQRLSEIHLPKNWTLLRDFLRRGGIDAPLRLRQDPDIGGCLDCQGIMFESRTETEYSMAAYEFHRLTPDGKKAVKAYRDLTYGLRVAL